jgi:aspartate/methionine/tyrosine aminotransferase
MAPHKPTRCTKRSEKIHPFYVMELMEKAQLLEEKGADIVHMEIGEPDFPTPSPVREAAIQAIEEGHTFYTHSLGLPELRARIALHYMDSYGVSISPKRIIITNGTSGAFFLLSAILLSKRRNLVISDPGYPCYRNFGALFDANVLSLPVSAASHYEIQAEQIRGLDCTPHLTMVCSPANPTGTIYGRETLSALYNTVAGKGGILVVDEIYSGLSYIDDFPEALTISDDIVVIDGFSKSYAMTGWRLGWMVVPEWLMRPAQKVSQNVFISAPTISQYAAMKAFDMTNDINEMKATYRTRRDFLFYRLNELGFGLSAIPEGAFYIYADISRWRMDSMHFSERALTEAGVAITPGYDFGSHEAGSHVRFSYANSLERLQTGCNRLEKWLPGLSNTR